MPKQEAQPREGATQIPPLPKTLEKRVSLKWITLEALSKLAARYQNGDQPSRVMLLTAWGKIEGRLEEIKPSSAESFHQADDRLLPDIASMVTHMRTELLTLYEQEEEQLNVVDAAPILSLTDVTLREGAKQTRLPQLTVFADQVIGFSLASVPQVH
jgi:hypothetical protein